MGLDPSVFGRLYQGYSVGHNSIVAVVTRVERPNGKAT
jgi:hypothetical protein